MTLDAHKEVFGHTRYHNMKMVNIEGTINVGKLYPCDFLSRHPESAALVEKLEGMQENTLLPCPFCTGEAESFVAGYDYTKLHCIDCGAEMENNRKAWNKRAGKL